MRKWLPRYIVPLLIVLGAMLLPAAASLAAQPDLVITGTGLNEDVLIYPGDWKSFKYYERLYSTNNNFNFHKIWKVKGYDLFELIGTRNLKSQKYAITFMAKDGAKVTKAISELRSQYYYPKFSGEGSLVAPMIGFYSAVLFNPDYQRKPNPADIIWQDRGLTEADRDYEESPRLYYGQALGQYSENNQSFFLKNLARIVVGEERPSTNEPPASDDDKAPDDPTTGKTTPGKGDTKPSPPDSPPAKTDPEKDPEDTEVKSDESNGETADGEKAQEGDDGGNSDANGNTGEPDGDVDSVDSASGEVTDEQPYKIRWPWITAGVILVGGSAVGAYFYTRMRGDQNNDQ